jgi:putative nucleotidyltransferase with HDIG domain
MKARILIALVAAAGLAAVLAAPAVGELRELDLGLFALFLVLSAVTQRMRVDLFRNASVSVQFAVTAATYALFGVAPAIWVNLVAAAVLAITPRPKPLPKVVFNFGNLALAAFLAGVAYQALGGRTPPQDLAVTVFAAIGAGILYFAVSTSLVSAAVASTTDTPFLAHWRQNYAWTAVSFVALAVNGSGLALATQSLGVFGFVVFTLPLGVAWYSFTLYTAKSREVRERNEELHGMNEVLERTNERLENATISLVGALVGALDAKDHYTEGHCAATMFHALGVGRKLGLPKEELARIELAALFHDIGKIGIPEQILRKPGPLTAEEWDVMRTHTTIGGEILAKVPALERVRPIVTAHHERFDGTGYPRGLVGDQIPLGARIIAVADAYHAMTSDRPYREAMPRRVARRELRRHAGGQFDPAVVDAFIAVLAEHRRRARAGEARPHDERISLRELARAAASL